jgi:hypothetical protein
MLILADGVGSNGSRRRQWKYEPHRLSNEIGIPIRVCRYPLRTSKWNKIEHCLFPFISMNWRGVPLTDYQTIVDLIRKTRTRTGHSVRGQLDTNKYDLGVQITDEHVLQIKLLGGGGVNSTRIGIIFYNLRYAICSIYFLANHYYTGYILALFGNFSFRTTSIACLLRPPLYRRVISATQPLHSVSSLFSLSVGFSQRLPAPNFAVPSIPTRL